MHYAPRDDEVKAVDQAFSHGRSTGEDFTILLPDELRSGVVDKAEHVGSIQLVHSATLRPSPACVMPFPRRA